MFGRFVLWFSSLSGVFRMGSVLIQRYLRKEELLKLGIRLVVVENAN